MSINTRHCQLCRMVPAPVCGVGSSQQQLLVLVTRVLRGGCETGGLILSALSHSCCMIPAENPPGAAGNHPLAESSTTASGGCRPVAYTAGAPLGAVKKRPF